MSSSTKHLCALRWSTLVVAGSIFLSACAGENASQGVDVPSVSPEAPQVAPAPAVQSAPTLPRPDAVLEADVVEGLPVDGMGFSVSSQNANGQRWHLVLSQVQDTALLMRLGNNPNSDEARNHERWSAVLAFEAEGNGQWQLAAPADLSTYKPPATARPAFVIKRIIGMGPETFSFNTAPDYVATSGTLTIEDFQFGYRDGKNAPDHFFRVTLDATMHPVDRASGAIDNDATGVTVRSNFVSEKVW